MVTSARKVQPSKMDHIYWQTNKSTIECNKYILENEVNCDVNFKFGQEQEIIKAHKFILSTRSPVFDRMFNGSFCESETDPVIPDVSPAAFRILLRYCYYDCLDIKGDIALSVLHAATKYMLPILERAARETLIIKLNSSIIWDVCKYSTEVGDEELCAGCVTFLKGTLSYSNILDIIKYACATGNTALHDYCKTNSPDCLNGSNIWDVYKYAFNQGDTEVHQNCKKYFERDIVTVRDALHSEEFRSISHEMLSDILHINDKAMDIEYTPGISISEIELFKACNVWAEAECIRQQIDPNGANKRTVLGKSLFLIRFPTILPIDLLTVVYPTGILTPVQMVNIGRYIQRDPDFKWRVDFPSKKRQFVVTPLDSGSAVNISTVFIESDVRVMLSRLWTWLPGSYKVTVSNERSQTSWSTLLDTKHGNHLAATRNYILHYLDIEPPQVLEVGTRYSITAECIKDSTFITKQQGIQYIRIPDGVDPYKEMKITRAPNTNCYRMYSQAFSLV